MAVGLLTLAALLTIVFPRLCSSNAPTVTFHSPTIDEPVSGRTLVIDVEIGPGYTVPEDGKGVLFLNGNKLVEVRQQRMTISMDGAGGLLEGVHTLRLDMVSSRGGEVIPGTPHSFMKEGEVEEGPFHDGRFDGEDLKEMEEACAAYAASYEQRLPVRDPSDSSEATTIALGLPVVSSKTKYDGEEEDDMRVQIMRQDGFFTDELQHPLMTVFVPSLLQQMAKEKGNYTYQVWLGFDQGDPLFDHPPTRARLSASLSQLSAGRPVTYHWARYEGMEGKVFWIYNDLFRQAYQRGADYFYMVNDDLLLVTDGWADSFVSALRNSPIAPNFGVAGPLDIRDRHKHHMCFAFHHRVHYEIFGVFYPPVFQNWWSDYWASLVFGPVATFWLKDVEVRNTEVAGRRYPAFWEGSDLLQDEVAIGRRRITQYCRCGVDGGTWSFEGCLLEN